MAINYPYRVFRYQVEIDGISRAEIASVVAAVRDMADTWLGSASHH